MGIDKISEEICNVFFEIEVRFVSIVCNLLFGFLFIEMVWKFGKVVMDGVEFSKYMFIVFKCIVVVGFFFFLIDGIFMFIGGVIGFGFFVIVSVEVFI